MQITLWFGSKRDGNEKSVEATLLKMETEEMGIAKDNENNNWHFVKIGDKYYANYPLNFEPIGDDYGVEQDQEIKIEEVTYTATPEQKKRRGRPQLGWTRKVSITLPEHVWSDLWKEAGFDPETGEQELPLSKILRQFITEKLGYNEDGTPKKRESD